LLQKPSGLGSHRSLYILEHPHEGTASSAFKDWSDELKELSSTIYNFVLFLRKFLKRATLAP